MSDNDFPPIVSTEIRSARAKSAWETVRARAVPVSADDITFGVEIECALDDNTIDSANIYIGEYHRGLRLPEPFPQGWTAQNDGSIEVEDCSGLEIVSPVLRGFDGLQQVARVLHILHDLGAVTNRTCGVHVHIGARSVLGERVNRYDTVAEWVRRLLCLVSHNELALYALAGNLSRVHNSYCGSIKGRWQSRLKPAPNASRVRMQCMGDNRYQSLNVSNLFGHSQTVEFRAFGATLNATKVIGYILVAIGLCQRAAALPVAPRFDNTQNSAITDARESLKRLHRMLGWRNGRGPRYGYPSQAWEAYSNAVLHNQNWNVNRFQNDWTPIVTPNTTTH